jgi:hypothetical protein
MKHTDNPANAVDLLRGWIAIGRHVGTSAHGAIYLSRAQGLPTFKLGKLRASTRQLLDRWIADKVAEAKVKDGLRRKPMLRRKRRPVTPEVAA